MKYLLFIATFVALANGRPEESIYSKRITSYGTPISDDALNINIDTNYPLNNIQENGISDKGGYKSTTEEIKPLNDDYRPISTNLPLGEKQLDATTNETPIIHKYVYVHVAPPEEEADIKKNQPNLPRPHKNYKIIFIKTPSPTISKYSFQLPQTEEKTIVYVLIKKQDDEPDLAVPSVTPTVPSKPEVYFIRYKTKEEAVSTISDAAKNRFGFMDRKFDKVGVPTDLISGGSISDALLGAGTIPTIVGDITTTETATVQDVTETSGPY